MGRLRRALWMSKNQTVPAAEDGRIKSSEVAGGEPRRCKVGPWIAASALASTHHPWVPAIGIGDPTAPKARRFVEAQCVAGGCGLAGIGAGGSSKGVHTPWAQVARLQQSESVMQGWQVPERQASPP